jgi:beta-mannosidase
MAVLTLTMADTINSVWVNDRQVGFCDNHSDDGALMSASADNGQNTIKLVFTSAESHAIALAEKLPYPIPYSVYPVSAKHRNLVRKTQCHSGWDWGPCILSFGIYEPIQLAFVDEGLIESVTCDTKSRPDDSWDLIVEVVFNARRVQNLQCTADCAGATQRGSVETKVGLNKITFI